MSLIKGVTKAETTFHGRGTAKPVHRRVLPHMKFDKSTGAVCPIFPKKLNRIMIGLEVDIVNYNHIKSSMLSAECKLDRLQFITPEKAQITLGVADTGATVF